MAERRPGHLERGHGQEALIAVGQALDLGPIGAVKAHHHIFAEQQFGHRLGLVVGPAANEDARRDHAHASGDHQL